MIGVVLPVVLVVLTVLTGLIVTQVRRNAMDERLAANTRETVQLDNSVQTVLRWCEARSLAPQRTITVAPSTTGLPRGGRLAQLGSALVAGLLGAGAILGLRR